jgi:hypothetical protein
VTHEGNVNLLSALRIAADTHSATRRRRRALAITDTELRLIAVLAIIGLRRRR